MNALLDVILPVFLVIGAGYLATRGRLLSDAAIDGLMSFAQGIAVPCLLFQGVARLDLANDVALAPFLSFYIGALVCFAVGGLGARFIFHRPGPDCVAIGFACLFSNTLLLSQSRNCRLEVQDLVTKSFELSSRQRFREIVSNYVCGGTVFNHTFPSVYKVGDVEVLDVKMSSTLAGTCPTVLL